jgi:phosphoribosylamine--glycine ligase
MCRLAGLNIFGPTAEMARLEASKTYTKRLLRKLGILTANFEIFDNPEKARGYVMSLPKDAQKVVKADGLAAGKGVIICNNRDEILFAVTRIMDLKEFDDAGDTIIIEEKLNGWEVSAQFFCMRDGLVLPIELAQDYKLRFNPATCQESNPNTGGMGAYSPVPHFTSDLQLQAYHIAQQIVDETHYEGVLYLGLMIVDNKPWVLEINVRLGDPETQAVLARLETDLLEIELQGATGQGNITMLNWSTNKAVTVVLVSKKYPSPDYAKGEIITGIDRVPASEGDFKVMAYYAGISAKDGQLITSGGRIAAITGLAPSFYSAKRLAYEGVSLVSFDSKGYRLDIGKEVTSK